MTVSELIEELKLFPQEQRVIVPGYEDGFDDISLLRSIKIKDFDPAAWYYGRYDQAEEDGELAVCVVREPSVIEK